MQNKHKTQTLNKIFNINNLYKQENNEYKVGGHHNPNCTISALCPSTCDLRCEVLDLSSALKPVGRVERLQSCLYLSTRHTAPDIEGVPPLDARTRAFSNVSDVFCAHMLADMAVQ